MAGRRGAPRLAAPSLRAGGTDPRRAAGPLGTEPGRVGRAGGAPSVSAVPVGRVLRGAPTGATFKVNHPGSALCPSSASRHLSQWRSAGGGRGSGAVNPPRVIIPALRLVSAPLRRNPQVSLRPRRPGHLAHPCPRAPAPLPLLPYPACRAEVAPPQVASPSRPVTRHPGSAAPSRLLFVPPRAPRSGAASSRVALWRFGASLLGRPGGASGSVHLARSEPGPFLPCSSRVDAVRSWEAAVLPTRSRRR